ncbi:MarR family winged helix-turn-helix transcriptional regulator [Streptomyces cinnamoneus]|uniref:MarR family winged helix-turn-helix transcriptional regulator n=1 Tax=Streptomyces cinnamoneus TaxID=53446 RepID=UPI001EFDC10F|nr:MarR family transcriptional regulator [Streptomyces cinnamoneus]
MSKRTELLKWIADESRRHYAAWTVFNQALADHLGVHPTDLQCLNLLCLDDAEPQTTGGIAKLTGLTPGSATRLVDRLEKAGLVERRTDPTDRRRALVVLAPDATARIGAAWQVPGNAFREVLAGYSEEELTVIGDYLGKVTEVGRAQAERLGREGRAS